MKFLIALLAVLAVAAAEEQFDFANARPIEEFDYFYETHPGFANIKTSRKFNDFSSSNGGRIVGGSIATPGQFPYQVALLVNLPGGTALCGGSIISDTYVLTAAHCIDGNTMSVQIVFGAHDRTIQEPEQVRITVPAANFAIHSQWTPNLIRNDIAIIRLNSPITFTPRIQPVTLPTRSQAAELFVGEQAIVSGFGRFSDGSTATSAVVRFVQIPVMTNLACQLTFPGSVVESNICGSGADGRSACNGDSGGPFNVIRNGQSLQVGIVSFGLAAGCEVGGPSVFARVTSFLDWIEQNSSITIAA